MTPELPSPPPSLWRRIRLSLLEFALFLAAVAFWLIALYGLMISLLWTGAAPGFEPIADDGFRWVVLLSGFAWFIGFWLFWRHRWQRTLARFFPHSWLLDSEYLHAEQRRREAAAKAASMTAPGAVSTWDQAADGDGGRAEDAAEEDSPSPAQRQLQRYRAVADQRREL